MAGGPIDAEAAVEVVGLLTDGRDAVVEARASARRATELLLAMPGLGVLTYVAAALDPALEPVERAFDAAVDRMQIAAGRDP